MNSIFYYSGVVKVNPTYSNKQEEQTPQSQPFPCETDPGLDEPIYTDADNLYSVAQDDAYSLGVSGCDECSNTDQQGYSVVKVNDSEDLYYDLSSVYTD